ncbi:MAG: DMT family transporter [Rikenellaceae bacterium]
MEFHNKKYLYHFLAILTSTIWGTTFVSTKVLMTHGLSPYEIMFYRFMLAYVGLCFIQPRKIFSLSIGDELKFVCAGLFGGSLYFASENTALSITLTSNVALIICTVPILTAIVSRIFNRNERLKNNIVFGSMVAMVGVALVVFNGRFILKISPLGDILTLFAALMWAFYSLVLKDLSGRYSILFITRKVFFYGIVTLLPMFIIHPFHFDVKVISMPIVFINLLFLGLIASLLCYIMWNNTVRVLGAVRATNYIYLTPIVTLITSYLAIDEVITYVALMGSVFILFGVYVAEKGFPFIRKPNTTTM